MALINFRSAAFIFLDFSFSTGSPEDHLLIVYFKNSNLVPCSQKDKLQKGIAVSLQFLTNQISSSIILILS